MAKSINGVVDDAEADSTTPICRCRVLYLGSAVPHITKDGLQGIQEPLRDLYPEQGVFWNAERDHTATGIDSWLSVWSNGILVENVDDKGNTVRRFHPIESLHYCAAVRYVSVPASPNESTTNSDGKIAKFLPLDSPFSKSTVIELNAAHPPLFACILRRTSGIKVLECHAFICKKEAAANALVRCCFHAYADTMHARQIEIESPYERLDKRRSRSIGSALDSQSLIDEKISSWQKNSTGGSSSGSPEEAHNGFSENRPISRQKARTPSVASLVSHTIAEPNGLPPQSMEPIYYNGMGNGTLRSVRSFISLATLKSQKKLRPRQIPIPISAPPPPPPVMFATLSKKELKKVLKKESTLKRKHKYKDFPGPFITPNGFPIIYGPPPPTLPPPHNGPMSIYASLPPPVPGPFFTLDRKGRMAPPPIPPHGPPSHHMPLENGHIHPPPPPSHMDEPIYMPALSSPNGTLRPVTPHGEPIYIDARNGAPMPPPHMGPQPMFISHPQAGGLVPCIMPTLSRKELKEWEKQKQAMLKKAAKKDKKKLKNGKMTNGHVEDVEQYQPNHPYCYTNEMADQEAIIVMPEMAPPPQSANYSNNNNSANGGIYKKKGHLNERAFSYSIRQEHRSRSNSLSNLAFENGTQSNGTVNGEDMSNHASSSSLKSSDATNNSHKQQYSNGVEYVEHNGKQAYLTNGDRLVNGNGIDPNALVSRMSNLKLNGNAHPPPPPPLPPNGYQYKKTATIKRH